MCAFECAVRHSISCGNCLQSVDTYRTHHYPFYPSNVLFLAQQYKITHLVVLPKALTRTALHLALYDNIPQCALLATISGLSEGHFLG